LQKQLEQMQFEIDELKINLNSAEHNILEKDAILKFYF
jgi:hypothetical protein